MLPADLEPRMTGADLAEWAGFERLYGPLLIQERMDAAQAMLSETVARSHGVKGDLSAQKFMPRWYTPPRRDQSADELVEVLRTWARRKPSR